MFGFGPPNPTVDRFVMSVRNDMSSEVTNIALPNLTILNQIVSNLVLFIQIKPISMICKLPFRFSFEKKSWVFQKLQGMGCFSMILN